MRNIKYHRLYLVISEEYAKGRSAAEVAKAAIAGGVDIIQMREKTKSREELILLGKELSMICSGSGVKFIVNDDPHLAKEVGADGVHLGQEDSARYPVTEARRIMGPDAIIGISTHSPEQFEKANSDDFDYIAFGPVFPTRTKSYNIGTKDIPAILKTAKKPIVLIGGIDLSNVDELLAMGVKCIALIRDITGAKDITIRASAFKAKLDAIKENR